ncbi:MAG TPA: four helix bundle protein [Patescibacteria group bacterium]|nr:four helix bundle protein [Patescibacteria group bacterium]
MTQSLKEYDLEERTARFGESVIAFCKLTRQDEISKHLISQLVRSATSIGANYMEANGASSKKDFRNKIAICRKEAQETKHWLRMLAASEPDKKVQIREMWRECQELTLIFQKIFYSLKK